MTLIGASGGGKLTNSALTLRVVTLFSLVNPVLSSKDFFLLPRILFRNFFNQRIALDLRVLFITFIDLHMSLGLV